jgi:hypothetical protein
VRLYHTTDAAESILKAGFRDTEGAYLLWETTLCGVFLANVPVDVNEGAKGDQLLTVDIPDSIDLSTFEIVEDGKPYREWCVPASILDEHGVVQRAAGESP